MCGQGGDVCVLMYIARTYEVWCPFLGMCGLSVLCVEWLRV